METPTPIRAGGIFDYYILSEETPQELLPRQGLYYVLANNGVFMHKGNLDVKDERNGLVESMTRVLSPPAPFRSKYSVNSKWVSKWDDEPEDVGFKLPGLQDCQSYANIKIPQIPHDIAYLALKFFSTVFAQHGSESEVQLYYSITLDQFKLVCPTQQVSRGGVEYNRESSTLLDTPEGRFLRAGTIHSHCDFGAFHSGTDTADEKYEDGIHITFGHVNAQPFSVVSTVVANNNRFEMDPMDCIEGIQFAEERTERSKSWAGGTQEIHKYFYMNPLDSLLEAQALEQVYDWMPRVTKQTWSRNLGFSGKRYRHNG